MAANNPTACLLVIGNEVLSGRTQDANIQFLATGLGELGIPLREVRVIPDVPQTIIDTVNEVRAKFDYVFTTGGIGPTHDDITSECVAAAFGVPWEPHPVAWARMEAAYKPGELQCRASAHGDDAARRHADRECASVAPGFQIGNVYVMAGVPRIMQSMFEWLAPRLQGGPKIESARGARDRRARGDDRRGAWRDPGERYPADRSRQLPVLPRQRQRRGPGRQGHRRRGGGGGDRGGDGADLGIWQGAGGTGGAGGGINPPRTPGRPYVCCDYRALCGARILDLHRSDQISSRAFSP